MRRERKTMKIDPKDIRSIEVIQKPDGRYFRIGYAKKQDPKGRAEKAIKQAWHNNTVKITVTALATVVAYSLFKAAIGL